MRPQGEDLHEGRPVIWRPNSKPQTRFLQSNCYEALYGGAAGGGKSDALLLAATRHVSHPRYHAMLLRRTFADLERTLIKRSLELYPQLAERPTYNASSHTWKFPSGARIEFGHIQHEKDVFSYQGLEAQFIGFDELTHFTEAQYRYLLSRARTANARGHETVPVRIRASTNPGGDGHAWVMRRWAPWLWREPGTAELPTWDGPRAKSGEPLYYRLTDDGEVWTEKGPDTFGRIFVGAKATDNPDVDPNYVRSLAAQDAVTRAQLRDGDWLARAAAGSYFKRQWFDLVQVPPADQVIFRIRYWDRAATEAEAGKDPDWTVGVKLARLSSGLFFVEDVVRTRSRPMDVERIIKQTAQFDGRGVMVGIEQDPGQAGVSEAEAYVRLLAGWNVRLFRPTGDKETRAKPVSAQAEARNVKLVRGQWNEAFLQVLESFPEGAHDDDVDSLSGAFNAACEDAGSVLFRMQAY